MRISDLHLSASRRYRIITSHRGRARRVYVVKTRFAYRADICIAYLFKRPGDYELGSRVAESFRYVSQFRNRLISTSYRNELHRARFINRALRYSVI